MTAFKKIAFLFPGQGAQYPGMGKDWATTFPEARQTFEEADDLLGWNLSKIIFEGPEPQLTETRNSQLGIYVMSIALFRVMQKLFQLSPAYCAGLSLGEYTALHSTGKTSFAEGLSVVQHRGQCMNDACLVTQGTMAVVLGLDADTVEQLVTEAHLPHDLWVANFNCPGQVVISGTLKGIESGKNLALAKGAKRVLPLQVYGAFHSGLMRSAQERLAPRIHEMILQDSATHLVMNVLGQSVRNLDQIRDLLIKQVTSSVRWEQGIRHMVSEEVDLFLEMGCGKTLAGFNKRIAVPAPTVSLEKVEDLQTLEQLLLG